MIIPYGTDAPVRHWPIGTAALVISTGIIYALDRLDVLPPLAVNHLALRFDKALHPLQWFTWILAPFPWRILWLGFDIFYLLANLAGLWIFGMIVEGQLGWRKFLAVCFGLGVNIGAAVQIIAMALGRWGQSSGTLALAFGLLGMAAIWGPRNEVKVFWTIVFYGGLHTISLLTLGILFLIVEGGLAALYFMAANDLSGFIPIIGLLAGFPLGILLLKKGIVDCGGWDILSLRQGRPKRIKMYRPGRLEGAEFEEARESALELMREYLGERDPSMAAAVYRQSVAEAGAWELPMDVLNGLIDGFTAAGKPSEARPFIEEAIACDPQNRVDRTLLLARSCIEGDRDPVKGLEVLFSLPESLNESRSAQRDRLLEEASRIEAENPGPSSIAS